MPLYVGFIALADAIGKLKDTVRCIGTSPGNLRARALMLTQYMQWVSEISIDNEHLAAYAVWAGSKVARIILINSTPWEADSYVPSLHAPTWLRF